MNVHISLGVYSFLSFPFMSSTECPVLMDQSPLQHLCVSLLVALGSHSQGSVGEGGRGCTVGLPLLLVRTLSRFLLMGGD